MGVDLGELEPGVAGIAVRPGHSVSKPLILAGGSYRGSYRTRRVPRRARDVGHGWRWTSTDVVGRDRESALARAVSMDVHRRPIVDDRPVGAERVAFLPSDRLADCKHAGHLGTRSPRRRPPRAAHRARASRAVVAAVPGIGVDQTCAAPVARRAVRSDLEATRRHGRAGAGGC